MIAKIINFMITFVGAMVIVTIYDEVEPSIRALRGEVGEATNNTNTSIPAQGGERMLEQEQQQEELAPCSRHADLDACNGSSDGRGRECHWCAHHLLVSKIGCVADNSQIYKFAPCNNWICFNEEEPAKSDIEACERF